jgi:hypothetical protein
MCDLDIDIDTTYNIFHEHVLIVIIGNYTQQNYLSIKLLMSFLVTFFVKETWLLPIFFFKV